MIFVVSSVYILMDYILRLNLGFTVSTEFVDKYWGAIK